MGIKIELLLSNVVHRIVMGCKIKAFLAQVDGRGK